MAAHVCVPAVPGLSVCVVTDANTERVDIAQTARDLVHVDLGVHDWQKLVGLGVGAQSAVNRLQGYNEGKAVKQGG